MSHDILHEATRALREATPERPAVGDLTRARVMQSLHRQKRRGVARTLVWFPLAAIFIGASAAAASGNLPRVWNAVTSVVGIKHVSERTSLPKGAGRGRARPLRRMPVPPPSSLPTLAPEAVQPEAAPNEVSETPTDELTQAPATPASAARTVRRTMTPEEAQAYALYREAHSAHFAERAYPRALAAWNRYLARHPGDRLAPEARYNRALCLVRLGRYAEATPALRHFAKGQYGRYRQQDAQRLLDAISPLDDDPSQPETLP